MTIKLDAYDKKLLYQLDLNARQSYVQLGKKVGLSKDAIKYRINNYLKTGLLDGFYVLINSLKLGFMPVRVYFNLRNITSVKQKEIFEYWNNEKTTGYIASAEGSYEVILGIWIKELSEFDKLWRKFKQEYSSYIKNEKQGVFIELNHYNRNYLINSKEDQISTNTISKVKNNLVDKIDLQILSFLSKDARMQIIDICKEVKLTSKAVINRIKSLEKKKIILGYKPKINLEKIGYSVYKFDLTLTNQSNLDKIKTYIYNLPNIIMSETLLGGSDFEFDLELANEQELYKFLDVLKEKFGEDIESISYYKTIKIYKSVYLPE